MATTSAQLYINPKFVPQQPLQATNRQQHQLCDARVIPNFDAADDDEDNMPVGADAIVIHENLNAFNQINNKQPNTVINNAMYNEHVSVHNSNSRRVPPQPVYYAADHQPSLRTRPASDSLTTTAGGMRMSRSIHLPQQQAQSQKSDPSAMAAQPSMLNYDGSYSTFPRMHAKQQQQQHLPYIIVGQQQQQLVSNNNHSSTPQYAVVRKIKNQPQQQQPYYSNVLTRRSTNSLRDTAGERHLTQVGLPPAAYPTTVDELRGEMIDATIFKRDTGLGVTIIGGENDEPLQVKSIVPDSAADVDGVLQPGDLLVFINGHNVLNFTHESVIEIFKSIAVGQKVRIIACRGYPLFTDDSEAPTEYIKEYAVDHTNDSKISSIHADKITNESKDQKAAAKQMLNGGLPSLSTENKVEERAVTIRKGSVGFGFTIEHSSSTGYQKIKKIGDKKRCGELREGDLLIQINGQRLNTYSHSDIVNVLKRYPPHKDAIFHILRPFSLPKQQNGSSRQSTSPAAASRARSKSASSSTNSVGVEKAPSHHHHRQNGEESKHSFLGNLFFGGKHRRSQRSEKDGDTNNTSHEAATVLSVVEDAANGFESTGVLNQHHQRTPSTGNNNNFNRNQNVYSSFARIVTPCFVPASHYAAAAAVASPAVEDQPPNMAARYRQQPQEPIVTSSTLFTSMPPPANQHYNNNNNSNRAFVDSAELRQQQQRYMVSATQQDDSEIQCTPLPTSSTYPYNNQHQPPLASILAKRSSSGKHLMQYSNEYADSDTVQPTDLQQQHQMILSASENDDDGQTTPTDGQHHHHQQQQQLGEYEQLQILLKRDDNGFGFRVVGGSEEGTQVSVGYIVPNGAAQCDGRLQTGDEILSVDSETTIGASHEHTVNVIRRAAENGFILLGILRRNFVDVEEEDMNEPSVPHVVLGGVSPPKRSQQAAPLEIVEFNLVRGTDEGFGFVLVSSMANSVVTPTIESKDGDESVDGVNNSSVQRLNACPVIGRILPNSPAQRCDAFHVGDRLLRVNGIDIYNYQHKDIVNIIKNSGNAVTLTIASAPPPTPSPSASSPQQDSRMLAYDDRSHTNNTGNKSAPRLTANSNRQAVPQIHRQQFVAGGNGVQYRHNESPPSFQSSSTTTTTTSDGGGVASSITSSSATSTNTLMSNNNSADNNNDGMPSSSTPVQFIQRTAAGGGSGHFLPRSNTVPIHTDAVGRSTAAVTPQFSDDDRHMSTATAAATDSSKVHPVLLTSKSVYNVNYLNVELAKGPRGFGFSIRGGKEFDSIPLFVLKIAADGPAAESKMRMGDEILEINGVNAAQLTHAEAIGLIKDGGNVVKLLLKRPRRAAPAVSSNGSAGPSI